MPTESIRKLGLYVSYNERKNGAFVEAVRISNQAGHLTWLNKVRLNPAKLQFPTDIIIRLTGEERYFRGTLETVKLADGLDPNFALDERDHRPSAWRRRDELAFPRPNKDYRSALFIKRLREVPPPREVEGFRPPQSQRYFEL